MIAVCRKQGILAVEMEAAALYALASARQYEIVCFAHVTNQMGQTEGDFEKGETQGAQTSLHIMNHTAHHWRQWHRTRDRSRGSGSPGEASHPPGTPAKPGDQLSSVDYFHFADKQRS